MKLSNRIIVMICLISVVQMICPARAVGYAPWDELSEDSWIQFLGGSTPNMYPVNAEDDGDIEPSYPISFVQAASYNKARGMNALKFIRGDLMEGHLVSKDKAGNFQIVNNGGSNVFTDILLLIAIDANNLSTNFSMTVNLSGHAPYFLDVNDFAYYDNEYGRPSGFYSITDPNIEPISYAFDTAMVTVYGISGVTGLDILGGTITVNYSFDYVPAPVVFSVYGFVADDPEPTIYRTNRAFVDVNNTSKRVSTFAVTIDGDVNSDLKVDFADFAIMSENWLAGMR